MCVYMRTYLFIYFTILKYSHFNIFIYNLDFYFFTYCFCQLVMIPFYVTNLYPSVTVIEKKKKKKLLPRCFWILCNVSLF